MMPVGFVSLSKMVASTLLSSCCLKIQIPRQTRLLVSSLIGRGRTLCMLSIYYMWSMASDSHPPMLPPDPRNCVSLPALARYRVWAILSTDLSPHRIRPCTLRLYPYTSWFSKLTKVDWVCGQLTVVSLTTLQSYPYHWFSCISP